MTFRQTATPGRHPGSLPADRGTLGGMNDEHDWRTASFCASRECIETASSAGAVLVRDKADREGPVLRFGSREWTAFVSSLKGPAA